MRAKRRTDKEIKESGKGVHSHKTASKENKKIDTSRNSDDLDVTAVTKAQRKKERKLVPLHIDARTVIYVTPEHNNEEYRIQWMRKYGYDLKGEKKVVKPNPIGGRDKMCFDKEKAKSMLLEAFSVKEISNEVNVSTTILYHFFSKNGISIPNCKEMIRILNSNGLSLDEIKKRMKIASITVEKLYRNL